MGGLFIKLKFRCTYLYLQLRYQKCLDAHPGVGRGGRGVGTPRTISATLRSVLGTITGRKARSAESWDEDSPLQVCGQFSVLISILASFFWCIHPFFDILIITSNDCCHSDTYFLQQKLCFSGSRSEYLKVLYISTTALSQLWQNVYLFTYNCVLLKDIIKSNLSNIKLTIKWMRCLVYFT